MSFFFQFTPFCTDLWRLFHPLMSEPNIAVHPNKQVRMFGFINGVDEVIGDFHDDVVLLQLSESSSFFLLLEFCNPSEVLITISLICKRIQQTEGYW